MQLTSQEGSTSEHRRTRAGERRWRLPPWLAVVVLGIAALGAALVSKGPSHARAPSVRPSAGASRSESAAGAATASLRPALAAPAPLAAPSLAGGRSSAAPPAPEFGATALLSGRVLDALGGPIAGAVVSALQEHSEVPLASTVVGHHGGFELHAPPGPVRVMAQADGYSTELRPAVAPAGDLTLSLAPASRIFGRVLDAAGSPVSGAVVHARALWRPESFAPSVLSDAEGRFAFEALSAGQYELRATAERRSGEPVRVVSRVADEVGPVELRMVAAVRVALGVERGGRACAGGWVQLSGDGFQGARELANGNVLFESVPAGDYLLALGCEQAAFQSHELSVGNEDIERTVHLDPGHALRGRVLDAEGAGVEGVLVTVSPTTSEARTQLTCRSGPNGDFLCEGLGAGGYRCHAGLELQAQSEAVDVQVRAGEPGAPVELRLWARASMVVSLEQVPADRLSGVRVLARPQQGPPLEGERRGSEFHFDALLLGSYAVYLEASPGTRRDVVLARSGQHVDVSLPWPSTSAISGVVLDERGQPAVEVWVHATAEGSFLPFAALSEAGVPALTDAAGRFSVEGLFEGRYHLRVEGIEREGFARSVSGGTRDVMIHLAAPEETEQPSETDEPGSADSRDSRNAPSRTVQRAPLGEPQPTKAEQP